MPAFQFQARDASGGRTSGIVEAVDASGAATLVADRGLIPIRIEAQAAAVRDSRPEGASEAASRGGETPESFDRIVRQLFPGRRAVKDVEVQLMTRELHAMQRAGVPLMRALQLLRESTANPALAESLRRVSNDLDSGVDLATAFERERERSGIFSPYYVSVVRIGEQTGRLDDALLNLSKQLQFQRETREQITAALRYPSFVVVAMGVALVVINLFVLPQFEHVFKSMHAQLPAITQMLLWGSRVFVKIWPLVLAGLVGAYFAWRAWVQTVSGRRAWDRFLLKLPIIGDLLKRTSVSRFAVSLSTALRSGVPVAHSLTIVAQTIGIVPYAEAVEGMRARVERGESLRTSTAATGMFPLVLQQVISVGEETGSLEELLGEIGEHYQTEVSYALSKLSARIEPILIVMLGVMVLILALGVFLPMWEMSRASMGGR
jgi:MSHA biogenesis protein MshG